MDVYEQQIARGLGRFAERSSRAIREGDCLLWPGPFDDKGHGLGAGLFGEPRAHRAAWRVANGQQIPPGHDVHHTCERPACINPDHLVLLTHAQHSRITAAGTFRGQSERTLDNLRGPKSPETLGIGPS